MQLKYPLETYFQYHPPITQRRKDLHERVNKEALELFKTLIVKSGNFFDMELQEKWLLVIEDICHEPTCQRWAKHSLKRAMQAASPYSETEERDEIVYEVIGFHQIGLQDEYCDKQREKIFMYVQQVRMFLNQGVTIQEIDE